MRILVTGGAGFVGSSLALMLKRDRPGDQVRAFDSLKRRGSELAIPRLQQSGVDFIHGDVRNQDDLLAAGAVDLLIDCSAEPSVQAGYGGGARQLVDVNLGGTVNCLEFVREQGAALVFLSTSRVYSIEALRDLPLEPRGERLVIPEQASGPGWSAQGIAGDFSTAGARSLYGTTKLCSELLVQEYAAMYELPAVINRCGVVAGPWQMGRVDQGFLALWAARHLWGGSLSYRGFGGTGLQVRDVLHVADLYDLVSSQIDSIEAHAGELYCVGGGAERCVSLRELTELCERRTGRSLAIGSDPETHPSDIPYFVTDHRVVTQKTGWTPKRKVEEILDDVLAWLRENASSLEPILGVAAAPAEGGIAT